MERFLADQTTREERRELFGLIRSEHHSDELGDKFMNKVNLHAGEPKTLQVITEEIFASLVEEHRELASEVPGIPPAYKPVTGWWKLAAAAMISLLIGAAVYVYRFKARPAENEHPVATVETTKALHTFFGRQYLRLPDGSKVILNKNSELSYDDSFGVISREVLLTGEAYFDIQHDASRPFQVHTGKVMTTVRGTAFNVKAPPQENKIIVTVKRGNVDVGDNNHTYETLVPNEQIAINTTTYSFMKTKLYTDVAFVWTSNFIILDEVGMEEAAAIISAHYNVNVTLENDQLKQCRISSTFLDNENLWDVLDAITTAINATFTMKGNEVMIQGKGCSKH